MRIVISYFLSFQCNKKAITLVTIITLQGSKKAKEPLQVNCAPIVRHNLTNWRRSFYEEIFRRRETNGCEKILV